MFDSAIDKLSTQGVKVEITVDDSVYLKFGATIVVSVVVSAIGYLLVTGIFSSK